MTDQPAPAAPTQIVAVGATRSTWKDWMPVISLLIVVATLLLGGGKTLAQVADNTRRIAALEQRADRRDDQLADLRERIGKIDAKLDVLLDSLKSKH